MNLITLNAQADAAADRYAVLTNSWQFLFQSALNAPDFGYGNQAAGVVGEAYALATKFLEGERLLVETAVEGIASEAHQSTLAQIVSNDTENDVDDALDHLIETQSYLTDELVAQVHRDIALVRSTLQRVVLEVRVAARSRRIPTRTALIEYRIANMDPLQFTFQDRASRHWSSRRFIRTLWRQTLLSAYNETVMMTIADHGLETAVVTRVDQGFETYGETISLAGSNELPSYSDIRQKLFHPNSNAYLSWERADVSS